MLNLGSTTNDGHNNNNNKNDGQTKIIIKIKIMISRNKHKRHKPVRWSLGFIHYTSKKLNISLLQAVRFSYSYIY